MIAMRMARNCGYLTCRTVGLRRSSGTGPANSHCPERIHIPKPTNDSPDCPSPHAGRAIIRLRLRPSGATSQGQLVFEPHVAKGGPGTAWPAATQLVYRRGSPRHCISLRLALPLWRSDRSFLISKCRYEENPNDPPNYPPTSVLLVLKLKFYTKIFALYSRR
jgi:hypothetical protein